MRGTIIKIPDSNPGIISAEGKQYGFELTGAWQGDAAPAANQVVEFTPGDDGEATAITVVSREVLAQENVKKAGKVIQQKAKEYYAIVKPFVDLQLRAMTVPVCVVAIIMEICYFYMDGISISSHGFVTDYSDSFTLNQFLGLRLTLQDLYCQFTFMQFLGCVVIFLPWVSPWLPLPKRNFLNAFPFILVGGMYGLRLSKGHGFINDIMDSSPDLLISKFADYDHFQTRVDFLNNVKIKATNIFMNDFTFSFGFWCVLVLSFVLLLLSLFMKRA